jgi:uncharacterized protein involved in response to NO
MKKGNSIEPYRWLFPMGVLFGALGVYVWIMYALNPTSIYPNQLHSKLMFGTFLFSFAAGFLMTAIPKMTASFPAQIFEIVLAFYLILMNSLFAYVTRPEYFYLSSAVSVLFLVAFFTRRFLARTKTPPPFFPFVILGLLIGFIGSLLLGMNAFYNFSAEILLMAKKFYFEGLILLLVLGIGSRLIPVISGRAKVDEKIDRSAVLKNVLLGLFLIAGYVFESYEYNLIGGLMRCLVVGWVGVFNWGLFLKAMHLTYIAGFGLMTLTVASRVTLAHGSYDLAFEAKSNALWICGALILTAAATRVAAPFTGSGYINHLGYAAVVWIVAIALWGFIFVKRMIWKGQGPVGC